MDERLLKSLRVNQRNQSGAIKDLRERVELLEREMVMIRDSHIYRLYLKRR